MLSRVAEALFWVGRCVERADGTARLLGLHLQLQAEDGGAGEDAAGRRLLAALGVGPTGPLDRARLLDVVAYDADSDVSVLSALVGASRHAGQARDHLPLELVDVLAGAHRSVPSGRWRAATPTTFLAWVLDRTAAAGGVVDAVMSRDDRWRLLLLGRSLERADATSRLLTLGAGAPGRRSPWPTALRAAGAQGAFLRARAGSPTSDADAVGFLLRDRTSPRSVVPALARAERCLVELGADEHRPAGEQDDAQRLLGRARAELEYRPLDDLVARLPDEAQRMRRTLRAATAALADRWSTGGGGPVGTWLPLADPVAAAPAAGADARWAGALGAGAVAAVADQGPDRLAQPDSAALLRVPALAGPGATGPRAGGPS